MNQPEKPFFLKHEETDKDFPFHIREHEEEKPAGRFEERHIAVRVKAQLNGEKKE